MASWGDGPAVANVPPGSVFPCNGGIVSIHGRGVGIVCDGGENSGGGNSNGLHNKPMMDMESLKTHLHHKGKPEGSGI